jgi:hypothetical protein
MGEDKFTDELKVISPDAKRDFEADETAGQNFRADL